MEGLDDEQERRARITALEELVEKLERERALHQGAADKLSRRIAILNRRLSELRNT